jgi:rsbT antagonist protein RsbS
VKLWDGVLIVPLVGTLDSGRTQLVTEQLLEALVETSSGYAIIDITGVPAVDTQVAQHLLKTVMAARLMGAQCIISGIRPQIAQTIATLGIEFGDHHQGQPGRRPRPHPARPRLRRVETPRRVMERVPILKLGDILLVSIQIDLEDQTALALQQDLSERIVATGARGVIIDISSLEIVDSFIGRMMSTVASASRVLDARTILVGMRPAVAITLVELGLSLPGVETALDVERALARLGASITVKEDGDGRAGADDGGDVAAEASPPTAAGRRSQQPSV